MELSDKEKGMLKRIVTDDAYSLLRHIANTMLNNWNKNPIDEETAFLTAKESIGREQRKKALTSFLETLEKLSHGE